jgi:hypothetical protein
VTKTNIYLVNGQLGETVEPRLVRATNRQQALSHVAKSMLTVTLASQEDLVSLIAEGVRVEDYKNTDQQELDI